MLRAPCVVVLTVDTARNALPLSLGRQRLIRERALNPLDGIFQEPHELAPGRSDASEKRTVSLDARKLTKQLLTLLASCVDVDLCCGAVDGHAAGGHRKQLIEHLDSLKDLIRAGSFDVAVVIIHAQKIWA